jgi:hypothetical protein
VLIPNINITFVEIGSTAYLTISFSPRLILRLNLLRPSSKSAPNQTSTKVRLLRTGRLNFPIVQPLIGPLLEWSSSSIHVPQYQVVDILKFAVSQNLSVCVD